MTPRPPSLSSREMQIMHMLREGVAVARVVDIGIYRSSWTADDVHAVLRRLEPPRKPPPPARKPPKPKPVRDTTHHDTCGTRSGYQRHLRDGEEACADCKPAAAEHSQRQRDITRIRERRAPIRSWAPETHNGPPLDVTLSHGRAQVLDGLCRGLTNPAIAAELGCSVETVKTQVRHVLATLGADNRAHAAVLVWSEQVRVLLDDQRRSAS